MIYTPAGQYPEVGPEYLAATAFFDYDKPALRARIEAALGDASTEVEKAVRLYYWVRDGWRYDPFSIRLTTQAHTASALLDMEGAYCVPKAVLLVAAARAAGIPAALGLSDVSNHMTSEKLKRWMGGNTVFVNHGYALLHVDGRWVKAAPAFNLDMCQRFGVRPTEFDGRNDAIFQEFDMQNRRHMEYVNERGCWSDFPYPTFEATMREAYPAADAWERGVDDPHFAPEPA